MPTSTTTAAPSASTATSKLQSLYNAFLLLQQMAGGGPAGGIAAGGNYEASTPSGRGFEDWIGIVMGGIIIVVGIVLLGLASDAVHDATETAKHVSKAAAAIAA